MDPRLTLKDFDMNYIQKNYYSDIFDTLEQVAPSDSIINGIIRKKGHKYEGSIKVNSRTGVFIARSKATDPISLGASLHSKLTQQIIRWKETRFSQTKIRNFRLQDIDDFVA